MTDDQSAVTLAKLLPFIRICWVEFWFFHGSKQALLHSDSMRLIKT